MATRPPVDPPIRGIGREVVGIILALGSIVTATWIVSTLVGWRAWALLGCLVLAAVGVSLLLRAIGDDGNPSGNGAETGRRIVVDPDDLDGLIPGR